MNNLWFFLMKLYKTGRYLLIDFVKTFFTFLFIVCFMLANLS